MGNTVETGVSVFSATDNPTWQIALRAAEFKHAKDIRVLDLREVTSFADFFLICTGQNKPQVQAIWDEIALQMKNQAGEIPHCVEGFDNAEWILGDYGDLLVHIFDPDKREYYGLERLWRHAKTVETPQATPAS